MSNQRNHETITENEKSEIKRSSLNYKQLAQKYNISIVYIGRIVRNEPITGY
ncbi:hypothetical protein [Aureivirga sp. CE67]|uniref:hypothetical protein n=1 Tax=Aureivirga sp. CE67 TaxID=1788983 RepID=UPI0018CAF933|nr:hypothetical protein [Aureivirga sp. CE67]